jgi:hypothetical protein
MSSLILPLLLRVSTNSRQLVLLEFREELLFVSAAECFEKLLLILMEKLLFVRESLEVLLM